MVLCIIGCVCLVAVIILVKLLDDVIRGNKTAMLGIILLTFSGIILIISGVIVALLKYIGGT